MKTNRKEYIVIVASERACNKKDLWADRRVKLKSTNKVL